MPTTLTANTLPPSITGGYSILPGTHETASGEEAGSERSSCRSVFTSPSFGGKTGSEPSEEASREEVESPLDPVERVILGKGYAKSSWKDLPEGLKSAITKSAVPNTDAHPGLKPAVAETRNSATDAQNREQSPDEQVQLPIVLGPNTGYIRREVPPKEASASIGSIHYIIIVATTLAADYLLCLDKLHPQKAYNALLKTPSAQNAYEVFKRDRLDGRSQTAAELNEALNDFQLAYRQSCA
jgi:hypothetical protein